MGGWIRRVPETIAEVNAWKSFFCLPDLLPFQACTLTDYRYPTMGSFYGGFRQDWMLIFSHRAYERELTTLRHGFSKKSMAETQKATAFCKQIFGCQKDAQKALDALKAECQYVHFTQEAIVPIETYAHKGKPKKDEQKVVKGYQIDLTCASSIQVLEEKKKSLGFFVLASNDLKGDLTPDQHKVERGFRFMKAPDFHAATIFVKKPQRVEAVLMLMALSLLVYAALEFRIRKALEEKQEILPNQSKKEVPNPTMKWIFSLFREIHCLYMPQQQQPILLNMTVIHHKIIYLFSSHIRKYYNIQERVRKVGYNC
jgi:transposase